MRRRISALLVWLLPLMAGSLSHAAPAEILVSRQLAEARQLAVGDRVRISTTRDDPGTEHRIVGIYEPLPDPFRLTDSRLEIRMHLPDLKRLNGDALDLQAADSVSRISVDLREGESAERFAADLLARYPLLQAQLTAGGAGDPFVVLERFHWAIAVVTVLGSTAFLLALMVMRSEERRQNAGVLRLIGITRRRVLQGVLVEGLWIAAAGTLIGLALALLLQDAFNRFFQWRYDTALLFVRVTTAIAIKCVLIAVPLGVLAGVISSWTLLRQDILKLIRR